MPRFVDERGALIAAEFPALPFEPKRVFMVSGAAGGSRRGGHTVACEQLIVLVAGAANLAVSAGPSSPVEKIALSAAGECVLLRTEEYIDYWLRDEASTVLVFASEAYSPREPEAQR